MPRATLMWVGCDAVVLVSAAETSREAVSKFNLTSVLGDVQLV